MSVTLAKVGVASSSLVSRSKFKRRLSKGKCLFRLCQTTTHHTTLFTRGNISPTSQWNAYSLLTRNLGIIKVFSRRFFKSTFLYQSGCVITCFNCNSARSNQLCKRTRRKTTHYDFSSWSRTFITCCGFSCPSCRSTNDD